MFHRHEAAAAGCLYGTYGQPRADVSRSVFEIGVEFAEHSTDSDFRLAVYCVDMNSRRRVQRLSLYVGDAFRPSDEEELAQPDWAFWCRRSKRPARFAAVQQARNAATAVQLTGAAFHDGQWVSWQCRRPGGQRLVAAYLLVEFERGPNPVLSSVLLDGCPSAAADVPLPTVDNDTQGRWRGRYGDWGGVFFTGTAGQHVAVVSAAARAAISAIDVYQPTPRCNWLSYRWDVGVCGSVRALQLPDDTFQTAVARVFNSNAACSSDESGVRPSKQQVQQLCAGHYAVPVCIEDTCFIAKTWLPGSKAGSLALLGDRLFVSYLLSDGWHIVCYATERLATPLFCLATNESTPRRRWQLAARCDALFVINEDRCLVDVLDRDGQHRLRCAAALPENRTLLSIAPSADASSLWALHEDASVLFLPDLLESDDDDDDNSDDGQHRWQAQISAFDLDGHLTRSFEPITTCEQPQQLFCTATDELLLRTTTAIHAITRVPGSEALTVRRLFGRLSPRSRIVDARGDLVVVSIDEKHLVALSRQLAAPLYTIAKAASLAVDQQSTLFYLVSVPSSRAPRAALQKWLFCPQVPPLAELCRPLVVKQLTSEAR